MYSQRKLQLSHLVSVLSENEPNKASLRSNVGTFQEERTQSGSFSERPIGRDLKALSLS